VTSHDHACAGCGGPPDRREFLRRAAGTAAALLVGLGASPAAALALPVGFGRGARRPGHGELAFSIPAEDGATIDKTNDIIMVRYRGAAYAFALSCPHQNTALRWMAEETRFQCPKHKSKYQPDGTFISGRATRNMDRLPIHSDGKQLLVDPDHVFESDKDSAGWAAAMVKL
jgi:nitrite reductase/ring-hydroxylating ferredoxin subunit